MPRNLKRITGRGDFHFLTFSCYERRPFLQSDATKDLFLNILGEVRASYGFCLGGYVVMPEHVHLLLSENPSAPPAKVIQVLKQRVSRTMRGAVNTPSADAADRKRFWQRRYYDFNVYSQEKFREKLEYMHENPVKRGLVTHPGEWPWSSWSFYAKGEGLITLDPWI